MAVPTRTSVEPSSTATSKSWLMPADRKIGGLLDLLQRLLYLVLAEIQLAGVSSGAHGVGGKCLRDGDEADRGGIAPRPAGRALDAGAHVGQPGANRGGVDHYFLSVPRIPFA